MDSKGEDSRHKRDRHRTSRDIFACFRLSYRGQGEIARIAKTNKISKLYLQHDTSAALTSKKRNTVMNSTQSREAYLRRIHKVQDYIENNFDKDLALDTLSEVACFSKFHFHRIFKAITHEPILQYVNRIKLERAALLLAHRSDINITTIAYHLGFAGSAVFSRAFKAHYGVSPTHYRNKKSRNNKVDYKNRGCAMEVQAKEVEVTTIDELRVIYVRYTGAYQGFGAAFPGMIEKLYQFAVNKNLLEPGKTKILTAYHDHPEVTKENQLRSSVCISVPNNVSIDVHSDIDVMSMSGKYAVGHFEVFQHEYGAAWEYLYREWLPSSSYQPRDTFPLEVYVSDPDVNPAGRQLIDIYLPIEPLGKM